MSNPLCDAYSSYYGVPKKREMGSTAQGKVRVPFLSTECPIRMQTLSSEYPHPASEAGRVWKFTTGRQSTFIRLSERDITCSTIRKFIGELGRGAIQKRDAKFTRVQPINGTVTT